MYKLGASGQKWLKSFHIFFACLWLGGGIGLTLMVLLMNANNGMQLYGINLSMKFIDDFVIIPGGIGSCGSGTLFNNLIDIILIYVL
jgi:hypothetical protein